MATSPDLAQSVRDALAEMSALRTDSDLLAQRLAHSRWVNDEICAFAALLADATIASSV